MRWVIIVSVILSGSLLLSGCDSDPIPTTGSAATAVTHPPKQALQKKKVL